MQLIVMTSTPWIEWDMHIDIRNALTKNDDKVNSYKKDIAHTLVAANISTT